MDAWVWLGLALTGLAAGVLSGLLGVGGGILMTPVLHYLLDKPWHEAVALSLVVIAVQSPIGLWRHHKKGAVDLRLAVPLTLAGAVGVGIGIVVEPRIGVPWLKLAFALILVAAAWRMARPDPVKAHDTRHPLPALLAIGLAAGIVSRLLGVGGGIITVPLLSMLGVAAQIAVGTSLVPVFTNAFVASAFNLGAGLDLVPGVPLAIGAVLGAPLGVKAAHALPEERLRKVVAVAMVLVAGMVAVEALQ